MTTQCYKSQHELLQERAAAVDLRAYHLHLDLSQVKESPTFSATSRIELTTTEPELFLDYLGESVKQVTVNGQVQDVDFDGSLIRLHGLPVGEELTIEVSGTSRYSRTGQGLHRMHDQADDATYLYSHLEPSDARRIFPCFDQPDLKATFDVTVSAPADRKVISNGAGTETAPGKHTFATTPLLSTFLVALIAGPYAQWTDSYTDEHGTIDLAGFFGTDETVRPGFQGIELGIRVAGPASEADYRRLEQAVAEHCPVLDNLTLGVPVTTSLEVAPAAA